MAFPTTITLCMGSSCFSRGNGKNLPRIQQFLTEHGLTARVTLRGCRCGGCCSGGPNMWVNGVLVPNMSPENLDAYLHALLPPDARLPTPDS